MEAMEATDTDTDTITTITDGAVKQLTMDRIIPMISEAAGEAIHYWPTFAFEKKTRKIIITLHFNPILTQYNCYTSTEIHFE